MLEGQRRLLGDGHPDALRSTTNLAFLLMDQGRLSEAEPLFRSALEGYRRVFGDHPNSLNSVNNLAIIINR